MTTFGFFSFARGEAAQGPISITPPPSPSVFDRACPIEPAPWCGAAHCRAWTSVQPPRASGLAMRKKSYAPWAYSREQRRIRGFWDPAHKVHRVMHENGPAGSSIQHVRNASATVDFAKFELSRPDRVMLWRSAAAGRRGSGAGKAYTTVAPLHNHSWAEVFRTRTTSGWYKKVGVAEGVLYGCWTCACTPTVSIPTLWGHSIGPTRRVLAPAACYRSVLERS